MVTSSSPGPARAAAALVVAAALGLSGCTSEADPGTVAEPVPTPVEVPSPSGSDPAASPDPSASPSPSDVPTGSPTGVAVGEVAEGFPLDVVPLLPEAELTLSNAVVQEGGGRTVALAGRTSRSAEEVVAFYTGALTDQGFTATTPPGVEGAVVTTFSRAAAADLLTLSVTSSGGLQDFSIGGQLA
ncbi:hypothetical protein [uncultured Pseudokineococcus sp.]|uniref:hypothetical protein n=1 Tax=uncultured Pseudokineococcus sp. TaxID=1642928 RepID=UPI002637B762|nr:hypothetical protein [uncultured Pseudokineococcus sp.]